MDVVIVGVLLLIVDLLLRALNNIAMSYSWLFSREVVKDDVQEQGFAGPVYQHLFVQL